MVQEPPAVPADPCRTRATLFEHLRSAKPAERDRAWSEFHARYAPVIAAFAKRCGAGAEDVEDVVQDVIASFYRVSDRFAYDPSKGRFRGWLKTCTVRAAVRRHGRALRLGGVPLDAVPEVELAVTPVWDDVWEQQLVARALRELRASSGGSLAFRAFEQYVLRDRPVEAVAAELGTSVANVYQAKTRMTVRLRAAVAALREADG